MEVNAKYTAYCGLCCLDCIPANHPLYAVVQELEDMLAACQFEAYADFKSQTLPGFADYPKFIRVLQEIKKLECLQPCTAGGGKPDCAIRRCALGKHYRGCWECAGSRTCRLLEPLKAVHPNLDRHLRLIAAHGPDHWAGQRGRHYRWEEKPETSRTRT